MAKVVATIRVMPDSPDANLAQIETQTLVKIKNFAGECETKVEKVPVAFGLSSVNITFVMDESLGSTDKLEEEISQIDSVQSCQTIDVRRAMG